MNKMSINKSNVRSLAAAIVAALILPSCVNLDENQGEGVGYLELPGLTADVEVYELVPTKSGTTTLSELGVTGYNVPDIEAITFNLTGPESYSKTWEGDLEALELPVGTYTLSGEYNNAGNVGLGEALYGDFETQVTISPQGTVTPEIKLPLINSLVAVSMAEGFDEHFTPAEGDCVTFTWEDEDVSVSAAVGKYVFVPASSKLTVLVEGKNSAGVYKELTYELTSPAAKTACNIVCEMTTTDVPSVILASDLSAGAFEDVLYFLPAVTVANISDANAAKLTYEIMGGDYSDWTTVTVKDTTTNGETYKYITGLTSGTTYSLRAGVGNIFSEGVSFTQVDFDDCVSVVASAVHTKDGNGDLNGTKVTASVSVTNLPSIIKELATVTATTGTFTNSEGKIRSETAAEAETTLSKDGQTSLEMKNPDGWPYIPQGENHKMTVNATCKIGKKTTYKTTSSKDNITVPEPEFSVTVSAYTSYDKYAATNNITKDIAGANNCDPKTLYNAGAKWGISTALMVNENYAKKLVVDIDGNKDRTFEVTTYADNKYYEDISGLSWASHSLTISFTFDGVTYEKQQTHHITGLPYSVSFYDITSAPSGWILGGNVSWTGYGWNKGDSADYLRLKGASSYSDRGRAISPQFNVPSNIKVQTTLDCMHYETSGGEQTIYVNANTAACPELTTNGTSIDYSVNFDNFDSVNDVVNTMTLSSSKPHITITHNVPKEGASTRFFGVKSFAIIYVN